MTLLDHFHPPLSQRRHWHAFHNAWAIYIAAELNRRLPKAYFAEANVQFGFETNVAATEESPAISKSGQSYQVVSSSVEISTEMEAGEVNASWLPSHPDQMIPFQFATNMFEILIFASDAGPVLVGAVELISPANKDRTAHRKAFVSKCETYLRQGVALVMVDVVTNRQANLHRELLVRLSAPDESSSQSSLYATAYQPIKAHKQPCLALWRRSLAVGQPLPVMPLWLGETLCIPVDLEATYQRTCQEQRCAAGDV